MVNIRRPRETPFWNALCKRKYSFGVMIPPEREPEEGNGSVDTGTKPFRVKDCALITLATGIKALDLRELRARLETIDDACIYHHFWGSRLRPCFDDPEFHNDFAVWAHRALHDKTLAERLSVIDPVEFSSIRDLRQELVEVIEQRLDESELAGWTRADEPFNFLRSQIVVFDTHKELSDPEELAREVPQMGTGSIFYHFIDARRRTPDSIDDFREWLLGFGSRYADLVGLIATVDPYFPTLVELRDRLGSLFKTYFGGLLE